MFSVSRLLSLLLICSTLVACDNSQSPQTASEDTLQGQIADVTYNEPTTNNIQRGMSEKDVAAILGDATLIQTHTLDELIITHRDWATKSGTISVQFQNGRVQFNQFTPLSK